MEYTRKEWAMIVPLALLALCAWTVAAWGLVTL